MKQFAFGVVATLFVLLSFSAVHFAEGKKAHLLLKQAVNSTNHTVFVLNSDALDEISKLKRPVLVVAAIGDARIGKSTTLNIVSDIWSETRQEQKIFETGDSFDAVTRGVWSHAILPKNEEGSILLLDVEGTNLGDDAVTDHISMFTALMSSGLCIFTRDMFANSNLDFLFRVSRLTDEVFPKASHENFPRLRVVIRGGLKPSGSRTLDDYVRDSLVNPDSGKNKQEEKRSIAKHFPKDSITASQIPVVHDLTMLENVQKFYGSEYWSAFSSLAKRFKEFPAKKSLNGNPLDGEALVDMARELVKTMNENSWLDFGNVYDMIETSICKRSYQSLVEPVLSLDAGAIESNTESVLRRFKTECALETQLTAARKTLQNAAKTKRELERLEKELKEAEEKRREALRKQEENEMLFKERMDGMENDLAAEKKAREEYAQEKKRLEEQVKQSIQNVNKLTEELRRKRKSWFRELIDGALDVIEVVFNF